MLVPLVKEIVVEVDVGARRVTIDPPAGPGGLDAHRRSSRSSPGCSTASSSASLLGRGIESGALEVNVVDLRPYGLGKHRSVDDEPYGGGAGMVMRPEPIFAAVEELRSERSHVVLLLPAGRCLRHAGVARLC